MGTHEFFGQIPQDDVVDLVDDLADKQPLDTDLTAIAALDSSTAGALVTDGSGWIRKTYAQLKTALSLTKSDVGLGNVDNTADTAKPVSTAQQTALDGKQPLDSDLTTIAGLTATTDNVIQSVGSAWASRTPAQLKSTLALAKGDVGLSNVDNTADTAKPVSTAQQTALDAKLDTSAAPELIRDTIGTALTAGANITITPSDAGDTITIAASGGSSGGTHHFRAVQGEFRTTAFPQIVKANGSNYPVPGLAFDAATEEAAFFYFRATGYTGGDVSVDVDWYADTASSGNIIWGAALAAITPNTDTQDIETDGLATAATVTDSHLGTTGQRLHRATVTVTSVDSLAADDSVALRVYRDADAGGDTMTGDAVLVGVTVSYS